MADLTGASRKTTNRINMTRQICASVSGFCAKSLTKQMRTPNQVVLAWMMQGTPPMIPLIASSSPERLQEDLGAEQLALTQDQLARLQQASA